MFRIKTYELLKSKDMTLKKGKNTKWEDVDLIKCPCFINILVIAMRECSCWLAKRWMAQT